MDLKFLREIKGLKQEDLADIFEIPVKTIRNWEQGERNMPKYLENLITDKLLKMTPEEIEEEKKYIVLENGELIFKGSKKECDKHLQNKKKEPAEAKDDKYMTEKYIKFITEEQTAERLRAYISTLSEAEKKEKIKIGNNTYDKYVVDFYKKNKFK